jgi:hypothetical protein
VSFNTLVSIALGGSHLFTETHEPRMQATKSQMRRQRPVCSMRRAVVQLRLFEVGSRLRTPCVSTLLMARHLMNVKTESEGLEAILIGSIRISSVLYRRGQTQTSNPVHRCCCRLHPDGKMLHCIVLLPNSPPTRPSSVVHPAPSIPSMP